MKQFAQLLRSYLDDSGVKQAHVATSAHISANYLNRLLSGTRNPSESVVQNIALALHLSTVQTCELFTAADFPPPPALLLTDLQEQNLHLSANSESNGAHQLIQQLYRMFQEIPEPLQPAFQDEMKHWLGYARYKYVLSGGIPLLDLQFKASRSALTTEPSVIEQRTQSSLDLIARIIGDLSDDDPVSEVLPKPEETLSIIDQLIGNILAGEISATTYQPHLITQTFHLLRVGAPWELRRRIAEALPRLSRLDSSGAEQLMEALRTDFDEIRGVDVRRRVIEALQPLFDISPHSLPVIVRLLQPRSEDDIYVALATIEACGDLQIKTKRMLEQAPGTESDPELMRILQQYLPEITKIQRLLVTSWEGKERECLQFSLALHNLLCAPDTLLISLREGLQSEERSIKLVAARYLERLLSLRPLETLELYKLLLYTITSRNVRRPVAKALPSLLSCLHEGSLSTRAEVRTIIMELARDSDVHIRRAVADHAMQIYHIDREFLLLLLRQMQKDSDQAIRHRLRPVALRLAEIWLIRYAETAGLVDTKPGRVKALQPFGE